MNLKKHFKTLALDAHKRSGAKSSDLVIDLGSNDGLLLKQFKKLGMRVLGVEPAKNISSLAKIYGIPTVNSFFGTKLASQILEHHGMAKIVTATNVLAHVDDLKDFITGIKYVLADDGIFIAEFPYLVDLINKNELDTIYHEHLSYFSLKPLILLFSELDMTLFDVARSNVHGGVNMYFCNQKG